jgi:hypothetical protein
MLTDGGFGGYGLTELEPEEDCGLSGVVKTQHQDSHLLLGVQAAEQLGKREPHLLSSDLASPACSAQNMIPKRQMSSCQIWLPNGAAAVQQQKEKCMR